MGVYHSYRDKKEHAEFTKKLQTTSRRKIKRERQEYNQQKLVNIRSRLTGQQCRLKDINTEEDPSTWLTILPNETKNNGSNFNIEQALSCKRGDFITRRHNRVDEGRLDVAARGL